MSEPYWSALGAPAGAGGVDYEGAWAAGTSYLAGDVVSYGGVNYLAVNPSTGVIPSGGVGGAFVTALPGSPIDGQEIVLVDSLSAPTYQWRLKYMAAKASNKWVFIGGAPGFQEIVSGEQTTSGLYVALTTPGPSFTVPVAGEYLITIACRTEASADAAVYMSFDIGATPANDNEAIIFTQAGGANRHYHRIREMRRTIAAGALVAKYKTSAGTVAYVCRSMEVTPVAVGG